MPVYRGTTLVRGPVLSDYFPEILSEGVSATSSRTVKTAAGDATPHVPGPIVEYHASLSVDISGIYVYIFGSTNSGTFDSSTLLEIFTGASGAEVLWATVNVGYQLDRATIWVPGFMAAGTRVSYRVRSVIASKSIGVMLVFLKKKALVPLAPISLGVDLANSCGTVVTAPGSLNTKGAWTQIGGVLSRAINQIAPSPSGGRGTTMSASGILYDIGKGADGAQTVIVPDIELICGASENIASRTPTIFGVSVASGDRLWCRYSRANAGNPLDVIYNVT